MPRDRSTILTSALKVNPSDVRWYFIGDYYDAPISGLVFFQNRLCRFCCFPEDIPKHHIYVLHDLSTEELTEELRIKAKFEALVGTHWSFDQEGKPLPRFLQPEQSQKRFYEEEEVGRCIAPWDRPVVAWFDFAPRTEP